MPRPAKNGDQQFWNIEISCSQWEGSACTQGALIFFLLSLGRGGEDFFHFSFDPNMFPSSSHRVLNMFPRFLMCFPRAFPIAPRFNPMCFAQSPPLLTYVGGPKGEALHLFLESSILGSFHSFFFFFVMGQSNWLIANKKSWTCESPPTNENK